MTTIPSKSLDKNSKKECEFKTYYALAQFYEASYRAIKDLMDAEGYQSIPEKTQKKVAKKIGKSPTWVSRKLGDAGTCSQKALAVFAGNYDKRIIISLVEPGHEKMVSDFVLMLETTLPQQCVLQENSFFELLMNFAKSFLPKDQSNPNTIEGFISQQTNQPIGIG